MMKNHVKYFWAVLLKVSTLKNHFKDRDCWRRKEPLKRNVDTFCISLVSQSSKLSSLLLKDLKDRGITLLGKGMRTGGMRDEERGRRCGKWLSFSQLSPQNSSPGSMASRSSWSARWWGQISQTPASWLPWIWPAPTVRRPRRAWLTSSWALTLQVRHWSLPPKPTTHRLPQNLGLCHHLLQFIHLSLHSCRRL